ncbi:MAG: (Fe-S)-binding protein, partial [Nitriliruptorales bacterium]
FWPAVGRSTVAVLEDAGFRVAIPDGPLCCGRPLYDFGFLDRADRYLGTLLDRLAPDAAAGVPIVGVEPSCVAVLRDELPKLRPDDPRARQVAGGTHTLAEFLLDVAGHELPRLERRAIVHGHCHQKGSIGMEADFRAFDRMGLDFTELDASCCGLAGSFGFEAGEKYEVSVAMGETRLLPAVRAADATTLIVADGFSCRTQIEHLQRLNGPGPAGHRRALHLAQLILMAREHGPDGVARRLLPEQPYVEDATDAS